jgi:hypothetical protein
MARLRVRFDHGLGDCVHFAHLLQLYKRRHYELSVHYEDNKDIVWKAAGIPWGELEGSSYHPWPYSKDFNHPEPDIDSSGSKIASNLNRSPLPNIGDVNGLWEELCSVNLEGSIDPYITEANIEEARTFLQHLPRPIILMHTSGTNMPESKNLSPDVVTEMYRLLLDRSPGSLVLLDWDYRVPVLAHARARHVKADWGHISLLQLAALMRESSLLIGVDSGPYHFAALTHTPALGVFHHHYPSCVTLPRAKNVNMISDVGRKSVNRARRPRWNIVEYAGSVPQARDIAHQALRIVEGPRYGLSIGRDVMLQQWIRDWCFESSGALPLIDRNHTLDFLLREASRRFAEPAIVETGCIGSPEDWTASGNTTYLFGAWMDGLGKGRLVSLDNDADRCLVARNATQQWRKSVSIECCDSVEWLRHTRERIDVLYLGSVEIESSGDAGRGLAEIQAAEPKLREGSIVVYDASPWNRGWVGNGAKGIPYLLERGWKVIAGGYQVVLSKV